MLAIERFKEKVDEMLAARLAHEKAEQRLAERLESRAKACHFKVRCGASARVASAQAAAALR